MPISKRAALTPVADLSAQARMKSLFRQNGDGIAVRAQGAWAPATGPASGKGVPELSPVASSAPGPSPGTPRTRSRCRHCVAWLSPGPVGLDLRVVWGLRTVASGAPQAQRAQVCLGITPCQGNLCRVPGKSVLGPKPGAAFGKWQ